MEIPDSHLVSNFPAQNRLLRSSSFLWEPGASLPGLTGAQGFRADAAIPNTIPDWLKIISVILASHLHMHANL